MKKIIIDMLWYFLNKLDPMGVVGVSLNPEEISIKIDKKFYRKNVWQNMNVSISAWIKKSNKTEMAGNALLYMNGKLERKYSLGDVLVWKRKLTKKERVAIYKKSKGNK